MRIVTSLYRRLVVISRANKEVGVEFEGVTTHFFGLATQFQ